LPRSDAEHEAFQHLVVEYSNATHPNTDPHVCAHCRGPDLPLTPVVPIGVDPNHAWLHRGCIEPWRKKRRAAVVEALAAMGIIGP
jgi:hypothetical protein